MVTTIKIVDEIMEDVIDNIYANYLYMQVGTTTLTIADNATTLSNSTQIGTTSALYNKLMDTTATGSFKIGKKAVYKFVLESGEPYTLPVNIGSVGLMKQQTSGAGLGVGGVFPVTVTKDNQSRFIMRCELNIRRAGE